MTETEDKDIGFASIGRRIAELKKGDNTEDVNALGQATEETIRVKQETLKQDTAQRILASRTEQTPSSIFLDTLIPKSILTSPTIAIVFWGIVAVVIVGSIFSGSDNKKADDKPSDQTASQYSPSPATDDDIVTVGQFRCTQVHHNKAQELKPSDYEKQSIENEQSALNSLKIDIETDYVDHYSQSSIDRHNMLIDDYNSRLQRARWNMNSFNNKVVTYNNYLINNCRRAY
ncbi:MAG: hypothetical protein HZA17_04075 [Nitrospirae bacterium]|nr:hypothetical protein [Nitrospirota bacterium]